MYITYAYQSAWLRFVISIRRHFHRCRFRPSHPQIIWCFSAYFILPRMSGYEMCSEFRTYTYIKTHMVRIDGSSFPHSTYANASTNLFPSDLCLLFAVFPICRLFTYSLLYELIRLKRNTLSSINWIIFSRICW